MTCLNFIGRISAGLGLLALVSPVQAEDLPTAGLRGSLGDETIKVDTSIGWQSIKAGEYVYDSNGRRVSALDWNISSPVAKSEIVARIAPGWRARARGTLAFDGMGNMVDTDWTSSSTTDWTDRSWSGNSLDHYLQADLALGMDVISNQPDMTATGYLGLRYTDLQMTAIGGHYIYSVNAFRDREGYSANVSAITYRQQIPSIYLGLNGSRTFGNWEFESGLEAGISVNAKDTDNHYLRSLLFGDTLQWAPNIGLDAKVKYNFTKVANVFFGASFQNQLEMRGPTTVTNYSTGAVTQESWDAAGADLRTLTLFAGAQLKF